jgi:hypothetical protein
MVLQLGGRVERKDRLLGELAGDSMGVLWELTQQLMASAPERPPQADLPPGPSCGPDPSTFSPSPYFPTPAPGCREERLSPLSTHLPCAEGLAHHPLTLSPTHNQRHTRSHTLTQTADKNAHSYLYTRALSHTHTLTHTHACTPTQMRTPSHTCPRVRGCTLARVHVFAMHSHLPTEAMPRAALHSCPHACSHSSHTRVSWATVKGHGGAGLFSCVWGSAL